MGRSFSLWSHQVHLNQFHPFTAARTAGYPVLVCWATVSSGMDYKWRLPTHNEADIPVPGQGGMRGKVCFHGTGLPLTLKLQMQPHWLTKCVDKWHPSMWNRLCAMLQIHKLCFGNQKTVFQTGSCEHSSQITGNLQSSSEPRTPSWSSPGCACSQGVLLPRGDTFPSESKK